MKMSVSLWTEVQGVLEETVPEKSRLLVHHIESRTFGKRWSQDVAIGLHKEDELMVMGAIAILEKEVEDNDAHRGIN